MHKSRALWPLKWIALLALSGCSYAMITPYTRTDYILARYDSLLVSNSTAHHMRSEPTRHGSQIEFSYPFDLRSSGPSKVVKVFLTSASFKGVDLPTKVNCSPGTEGLVSTDLAIQPGEEAHVFCRIVLDAPEGYRPNRDVDGVLSIPYSAEAGERKVIEFKYRLRVEDLT